MTAVVQEPKAPEVDYGSFTITAKRQILHLLAADVAPAVSSSDTRPVLKCFQLRVRDGVLRLTATNMEVNISGETRALVSSGDCLTYIPAKRLLAILTEAPEGDITIKVKKNLATITAGKGASWTLKLPAGDQFPVQPDLDLVQPEETSRTRFLDALKVVRPTAGRDASRPSFMQVDVAESSGSMYMTSSDGGRFTRARVEGFPVPMSIPVGSLDLLIKLLGNTAGDTIRVAALENRLMFTAGPITMLIKNFMHEFADVDRQLLGPAGENKLKLTVDREELVTAIRRVRINANPDTSAVALHVQPGRVVVETRDKERNAARETVLTGWPDDQGELLLTVSHGSLLSMLSVHPSNACVFHLARDIGRRRSMVLLADDEAGVTSIITQMPPGVLGY